MLKGVLLGVGVLLVTAVALLAGALYGNRVPLTREPGLKERLSIYLGRNVAETGPGARLPELGPLMLRGEPATLAREVAEVCRSLGWEAVAVDPESLTVSAEGVTPLLRFVDDVSIRLVPAGGAVEARVRSASRVGRGDLGANARHVMDLRAALRARGLTADDAR